MGNSDTNPGIDTDRRAEIARQALDIGMDDPYWLHNLSRNTRFSEGNDSLLSIADELRDDAELLETCYYKIQDEGWTPAEAALWIAENAEFGDYDTDKHLYDCIPIQGRNE